METYAKLSSRITDSSVWTMESKETRLLWIAMLSMADKNGNVYAAIPGLARRAVITLEECEYALKRLMSPDKYSRNPNNNGVRLIEIPGGWNILNYTLYRGETTDERRRRISRETTQRYRDKKRVTPVSHQCHSDTCDAYTDTDTDTDTDADTDADTDTDADIYPPGPPIGGNARARDQKTKTKKHIKKTYSKEVEMLWSNYPAQGRNGRAAVDKAWTKHRDASPGVEAVVESFRMHERLCPKWRDGYIKNLTTYINQHCWDDEFPDPRTIRPRGPMTIHDRNREVLEMYRRMADDERRENTANDRDIGEDRRLLSRTIFDIGFDACDVDGDAE